MKKLIVIFAVLAINASAQTNPPAFIKGTLDIKYNTRINVDSSGKPNKGVTDVYTVNVNVCNSAVFRGTVAHTPILQSTFGIAQPSALDYAIECDVVNPNNPAQTRNVGRIYGAVPIDANGVYRYADGNLKIGVLQIGNARGFESKFSGLAAGKPLVKSTGLLDSLKKEALNITKSVQGKTVKLAVSKYDKMEFKNHVLAAGPVQIYPDLTVNGVMIYDYNRLAWYFDGVTISYVAADGKQSTDRLTGSIRWMKSESKYDFDIRVNEPPPSEASVFAGAADESAFFATDDTLSALTGTMKYKDTTLKDVVTSSAVQIDLTGNKLSRQQAMSLCKLIVFSSIVPMNAE